MTKKTILRITVLLTIGFLLPKSVLGVGQMTKPIEIKEALRGQTIESTLVLYNSNEKDSVYGLEASGEIKDWTKFYLIDNPDNPINEIKIPAKSKINAIARFSVSSDTPNEEYVGEVAIVETPEKNSVSKISVSVGSRVGRQVFITVTDKEIINFTASVIPKNYDLEKNEPLSIRVIYSNKGNISITPEIRLKIKKDNQTITSIIYPYSESEAAVKSLAIKEISAIEIPTTNFEQGRYTAELSFFEKGNEVYKSSFKFSADISKVKAVKDLIAGIFDITALTNSNYKNWLISGLFGVFAIAFMVYSFSKPKKKKKVYVKKLKV